MTKAEAEVLLEKYNQGLATKTEAALLKYWFIHESSVNGEIMDMENYQDISEELWQLVDQKAKKPNNHLWQRFAAAAAILIVLSAGLFYFGRPGTSEMMTSVHQRDLKPGSNKAYLTLANGKRISLTDAANGELAREAGVEITKTADGQLTYTARHLEGGTTERPVSGRSLPAVEMTNTIETPKGGQYQVLLPDGSKVWLNAASKFSYPVSFKASKERRVSLNGEAYFEVAKDREHPFLVKGPGQEVKVLGTHFNINSYADERAIKTTLLEGSVRVNEAVLKPGQQSVLTGKKIQVLTADIESSIAWKNGDFIFKGEDFKTTMRKIARWYDVDIEYEPGLSENIELGGWVSRNSKLSEVLSRIELAGNVHFKVEGRRVLVTK